MRTTAASATQHVCYGNVGYLATELKILGFMTRPRVVAWQISQIGYTASVT